MADLGESIDVDNITIERGDFEPLPAGSYLVQVTDSDVIPTKAGTGTILKLTLEVIDGPYSNRKLWVNLNYRNPNATAQRIAQEQIKQICDAVEFTGQLTNSEDLHYKPMVAKVTVKRDPEYGDKNEVKSFKSGSSAPPAGKAQPQGGSGPAQRGASSGSAAGGGTRPWKKNAA